MRLERRDGFNDLIPENHDEAALTPFERALGAALLVGSDEFLAIARRQFDAATVERREFSDSGFFVHLRLATGDALPFHPAIRNGLGSATIRGPGLSHGATALFLGSDGRLTAIEAVAYGSDPWPLPLALAYIDGTAGPVSITPDPR